MNQQALSLIQSHKPGELKVLELSGKFWRDRCQYREYKAVSYPDYDVCAGPLPETFDLIIAEQVFEHLAWPYRAAKNIHEMLNPGGFFW
jgi:2-polyprenyl-3-methyl-5-hydroxy-6-metoxy-1,4-benzoquinol methylase